MPAGLEPAITALALDALASPQPPHPAAITRRQKRPATRTPVSTEGLPEGAGSSQAPRCAHRRAFGPCLALHQEVFLRRQGERIFSGQRTQNPGHHRSGRCDGRPAGVRCARPARSPGLGQAAQRGCRPGAGAGERTRLGRDGSAPSRHLRRHGRRARCPAACLAALGQPPGSRERQTRHLLAPARSHIRLAPNHLHGHGAPAQNIQTHNGQPSYRTMAYIYVNRRGNAKSLQFKFSVQPGGSAPSWNPSRPGMA